MAAYYITGHSMIALLGKRIDRNINIISLSFEEALPYWVNAFEKVLIDIETELSDFEDCSLFISVLRMLCYPDPGNRGHVKNISGYNQFNMVRFVAIFDRMARKAEIKIRNI